jgi:dinuclear metal center YbgI/SA1388 family protein
LLTIDVRILAFKHPIFFMRISDIIALFEQYAPSVYQENYDNSGLQVGNPDDTISAALLTLDITEEVLDEAIANNCNLIIAHHPLIFSGIKRLTGNNYVQRIVQKAIKHDINLFAVHTNLDNMRHGVNDRIAAKLGLINTKILAPVNNSLLKLYTYAPSIDANKVREALFAAGAGRIGNYSECSFNTLGNGTFKPDKGAQPYIGSAGGTRIDEAEVKIEVLVPVHLQNKVLRALKANHPYEEVAYELVALQNENQEIGAGLIGMLDSPLSELDFLQLLKTNMKADCIRHTALRNKKIEKVALCGGSGNFLLNDAIRASADVFVSADFKYHQFFDAESRIIIADIGHYETEQFTVEIFDAILKKNNVTFAVLLSTLVTNPIKYF